MPDGLVQRIDEDRGLVYLVRRGRTYAASLSEVESRARVPSARVSFEVRRRGGSETAVNVKLRTGARTNKRQRRFGDLTGARRPGAKVETIAARNHGVDVTTQPFRVARAWLEAMAEQDYDGAVSLYLPGAVLHTPAGTVTGRKFIRAELERCDLTALEADSAEVHGVDRYVRVDCSTNGQSHTTYLTIERGNIVEQWIDTEPDIATTDDQDEDVMLVTRGPVDTASQAYAQDKLTHLLGHVKRPVRFARVKLTRAENPAADHPAMAEVTVEFDKLLVRAHSTGTTFEEAVNRAVDRLGAQIESRRDRQRHRPTAQVAAPGTWRHGNLERTTTSFFQRPEEEREIVRHKSFAAGEMTIDEAAWDLAMLDYDFFLFVELESGLDALLERSDAGSLTLHRLLGTADQDLSTATPIEVSDIAPPTMAVSEAIAAMNASEQTLLFFRNTETDRANVVYRRYDGHYGLITPPSTADRAPETGATGTERTRTIGVADRCAEDDQRTEQRDDEHDGWTGDSPSLRGDRRQRARRRDR